MVPYSQLVDDVLKSGSRTFRASLVKSDGSVLDTQIVSFTTAFASNGDTSDFSIGSTVSQNVTITMTNMTNYNVEDKELQLIVSLLVDESTDTYQDFNMGYFTVGKPKSDEQETTFTAFDRMLKLETLFSSNLPDTTTSTAILNRITEITGVQFSAQDSDNFTNINMPKPVALTCREVLGYVAEFYGGFGVINRDGNIVIKRYSEYKVGSTVVGNTISPDIYWDTFQHNDLAYELQSIVCVVGKDEAGESIQYTSGSGTKHITFSNPYMTQASLDNIWNNYLHDFTYMPGSVKFLGDPRIDVWDIVTIVGTDNTSYKVPVMTMTHEFDGGLTTTITAVGKSESENTVSYTGPSTKAMDRYYAQLVTIDKALINYATIDQLFTRNIETGTLTAKWASVDELHSNYLDTEQLRANYASINELHNQYLNTNQLSAEYADITSLNTASGRIEILEGQYGNIQTILSGNIGTGQLQSVTLTSDNATIDGAAINVATMNAASIVSLISGKITVGDLLAGKISTNKFQVGSDSGNLLISDNVITIYDDSEPDPKPRIQMGKDAQGNYTLYIGNESGTLIDETGVHENAIGNELIIDRMVKKSGDGYDGIEANKLNIVSVMGALDDEGAFKASNIYFDDEKQTLTQIYTAIKQEVSENTKAIRGISSLDNLTSILSNDAHVVHTDMNGDGGNFTNAITQVSVYKGDLDVTNDSIIQVYPSSNVTGTWDASTKIYHVTALSGTDGYVDFDTAYGVGSAYLTTPDGERYTTRSGNELLVPIAAHVHKRFSISKALDGRVGVSYRLQTSASVIKRDLEDKLNPSDVTFSAIYSDGTGLYPYTNGKYRIEISQDGDEWDIDYTSKQAEASTTYTPANTTRFIRCTLLSDTNLLLDTISVIIITDADALATAMHDIHTDITKINTGIEGIEGHLQTTDTMITGVANGALLYQTPFTWSNDKQTANFRAVVYKSGQDATAEFPDRWFSWWLRTEEGEEKIQDGKTFSVSKSQLGFGGTVVGRFNTYETKNLTTRNGNPLTTRSGAYLQIYAE